MKTVLSVGLALALFGTTSVTAQSPSEFATQEARSHGENLFPYSSGWRVDQGPLTGSLSNGASHTVDVRLQSGERYGIIGGCDQDCSDLDLEITDQSGNSLDSDYLGDDFPMLEVSASYTGTYRMRVSMPSCSVNPCYYSYIVYRMSGGGGGGGSYTDVARNDLARREAQFFPSSGGWSPMGGTGTSSLRDGDSESFRLDLEGGVEYGVLATCDQDCTDIDLEITDRNGNSLDSDYLTDDFPILEFRTGSSGTHTLQVSMPGCSVSPCYYAYQVYRRSGGGGGVSSVSGNTAYAMQAREALADHVTSFFPRSEGWSITGEAVVRTLTDDSSEDLTVSLSGGVNYGIIATCDEDCDDIDLMIYDEAGNELDSDTLADDYPVLNFRTPYSGDFRLRVRMYSCSVSPCYYAYEIYRR